MAARYNPFRPGTIVNSGMFAGRGGELLTLEKILSQAKDGNPNHFLIHGERGIGKSSLMFYHQVVASGKITTLSDERLNFLTVSIELQQTNSETDIIKKIGSELQRQVQDSHAFRAAAGKAWDFLKKWEILGVRYGEQSKVTEPFELIEELAHTISQVCSNFATEIDGILILIDEADKPPIEANLGQTMKVLTERLTKRGCPHVCFGLAGVTGVVDKLRESHESAPRLFTILTLEPLVPKERVEAIQLGLDSANTRNEHETRITDEAAKLIADFSEGYPHFIQQFAYSAFDADTDYNIDEFDVKRGAEAENGAFQQLGQKYFQGLFFDSIGSDDYRAVLKHMANFGDGWVKKSDIRKATGLKESTITNAINALKTRQIIIPKKGIAGVYRLPTKAFAVWVKAYTSSPNPLS